MTPDFHTQSTVGQRTNVAWRDNRPIRIHTPISSVTLWSKCTIRSSDNNSLPPKIEHFDKIQKQLVRCSHFTEVTAAAAYGDLCDSSLSPSSCICLVCRCDGRCDCVILSRFHKPPNHQCTDDGTIMRRTNQHRLHAEKLSWIFSIICLSVVRTYISLLSPPHNASSSSSSSSSLPASTRAIGIFFRFRIRFVKVFVRAVHNRRCTENCVCALAVLCYVASIRNAMRNEAIESL